MRALRDFNIPKIVTDDVPIFMSLIQDLFPMLEVSRTQDTDFEAEVKRAAADLKLQPEENFILKVLHICVHTNKTIFNSNIEPNNNFNQFIFGEMKM